MMMPISKVIVNDADESESAKIMDATQTLCDGAALQVQDAQVENGRRKIKFSSLNVVNSEPLTQRKVVNLLPPTN